MSFLEGWVGGCGLEADSEAGAARQEHRQHGQYQHQMQAKAAAAVV